MWALAVIRPRTEYVVSQRLQSRALEHLIFRHKLIKFVRGQRFNYFVPAFPRYVFIRVVELMWHFMRTLRDLAGNNLLSYFVSSENNRPILIPDDEIQKLRSQADQDSVLYLPEPVARFRHGERIRWCGRTTVLRGSEGVFQFNTRPGRACILMPWLNEMRSVEVAEEDLEPFVEMRQQQQTEAPIKKKKRYRQRRERRSRLTYRAQGMLVAAA